jgi:quinol monooxygenase YgiN
MVIEYIRYKVAPSERQELVAAYTQAADLLKASPYCLAYELSECEEEAGQFMLRIEWTSTQEHLDGFRKSELFPPFFALVKGFFSQIQEMRHYQLTSVQWKKGNPIEMV